ncbi:MAG: hypothetical protein A2722_01945 [Candidatus Doudnabacteria bacterium RIFCSPHIGHO2_01_FULL_50_11]|uniref:Bifunctional protein FolD n=1 Tax=Candidatus Doudnabacteria bacterium RIFCSPHIGHO2_01_FULL_50_11 TaxID=1817828 RepID=A0A1F5PNI6_9BACT|nr:MAG: hypothetical protein A2722_01945 [Candidatus Doudnabacteria bacterium RIFCSPHIGHO2_01_FULL_50_11]HLC44540.1 bifunctional 5,10-methylenetetrahydrofolate dehydrogenase/5,10-methenyltetrahydrofolate cyclohydrolase [Patescibacteria group bacterium]
MRLLRGGPAAEKVYQAIKLDLSKLFTLGVRPSLSVILVGDDPASLSYIGVKKRKAEELGFKFDFRHFQEDVSEHTLCKEIVELNRVSGSCGIVIQLPLPVHFHRQQVLDCVLPSLDIDGLTSANQAKLSAGTPAFVPPTPAAILELLAYYKIRLAGRHVCIVGAGDLVGKPLSKILIHRGIAVSVATAATRSLATLTKSADIVITGVGSAGVIKGSMLKSGAVVIDAGTTLRSIEGKVRLLGDVDFKSAAKRASALTPTPGGVGPLTVAMLFRNAVDACLRMHT